MPQTIMLQHRTSKRYLAANPSLEPTGLHEVTAPINAAHYATDALAEGARARLGEFQDTYAVVTVDLGGAP